MVETDRCQWRGVVTEWSALPLRHNNGSVFGRKRRRRRRRKRWKNKKKKSTTWYTSITLTTWCHSDWVCVTNICRRCSAHRFKYSSRRISTRPVGTRWRRDSVPGRVVSDGHKQCWHPNVRRKSTPCLYRLFEQRCDISVATRRVIWTLITNWYLGGDQY